MRPSTVGPSWYDLFQAGTATAPPMVARVLVVADIVGALRHIHENTGCPKPHRRHGRVTPRHILIGLDGSASLIHCRKPFCHPLPTQPDLGYLAPEVLSGKGPANALSDVFSAGVLLWEALDNGRIFPHRQSAAILRLMGRKSLPQPRSVEEWAHPLREVAMKALHPDPTRRHQDATELWQELRDCLPSLEQARSLLSERVQGLVEFRLTDQILEKPPYLHSSPASQHPPVETQTQIPTVNASSREARYSLAPKNSEVCVARRIPEKGAPPSSRRQSASARPGPISQVVARRPATAEATRTGSQSARPNASQDPTTHTYNVNLPEGLVNASMPYLLTGPPAPTATPWGLFAVAAVAFFAAGAAVALGTVNALRPAPAPAPISFTVPTNNAASPAAAPDKRPRGTTAKASQGETHQRTQPGGRAKHQSKKARRRPASKRKRSDPTNKRATPSSSNTRGDLPFAESPF